MRFSWPALCTSLSFWSVFFPSRVSLLFGGSYSSLYNPPIVICLSFFFQAEDGIRDYKVTGVQTCALPICLHGPSGPISARPRRPALLTTRGVDQGYRRTCPGRAFCVPGCHLVISRRGLPPRPRSGAWSRGVRLAARRPEPGPDLVRPASPRPPRTGARVVSGPFRLDMPPSRGVLTVAPSTPV